VITIDGSTGEGGGQILRGSLALSAVSGQPFRIENIRKRRERPGLMRQHLTAVKAAQRVCNARVEGAEIGSLTLEFHPGPRASGHFELNIGSAGSTALVLQAILPALATLDDVSTVILEGGTHNPLAPTCDYFVGTLLPLLERIGWNVDLKLSRHGFYPAGGGKLTVQVRPRREARTFSLLERGERVSHSAVALLANLPRNIGERELATLRHKLNWETGLEIKHVESDGPGNVVMCAIAFEHVREQFTAFGEKRVAAERVADLAAEETLVYLASLAPVGPHLADQLLVPLALAKGGVYRTSEWTPHAESQRELLRVFLGATVRVAPFQHFVEVEVQTKLF
jgi:RNA 3'-terminal phosphate cyclase (ATP)